MSVSKPALLALSAILLAASVPGFALAQSNADKPLDLKPLLPPMRPFLPPNSQLSPGSISTPSPSPYSSGPMYDSQPAQPLPGVRLTIPR